MEAAAGTGPGGTCSLCLSCEAQGLVPQAAGESFVQVVKPHPQRVMLGIWKCSVNASHSLLLLTLLYSCKSPSRERDLLYSCSF